MKKQVTILLFCMLLLAACAGSAEKRPAEPVTPAIAVTATKENTATSIVMTEVPTAVATTHVPATLTPTTTLTPTPGATAAAAQITDYRELTLPAISIPVPEQPEGTDPYDLISWEQATESTLEAFYQLFTGSEAGTAWFSFKTYWTASSE